jgi:sugar phosphate isomerase/epimerase
MRLTAVGPIGFENFPPADFFPLLKRAGIDSVHVARDKKIKLPLDHVRGILTDYQLTAESYHCGFGSHIDLADDDPHKRLAALDAIALEAEFACDLGVGEMVIHPSGVEGTNPSARENFLRSLEGLIRVLERFPLRGLLENLPPSYSYGWRVEKLAADVKSFDVPQLGICLDTGHAHMRRDLPLADQIFAIGGYLHYIHAHDNNKIDDQHLLPMTGSIDWTSVFEALNEIKYTGSFCLEVFEPIKTLQRRLNPNWLEKISRYVVK